MESTLPETFKALQSQGPNTLPKVDIVPLTKPGSNEVVVKIEFAPLNPSDIMSMTGTIKGHDQSGKRRVGTEGSGTIVAVGENLVVPHQIGDKVHVVGPGTMAEYLVTQSTQCYKIKGNLTMEQAASHFVNPGTVYMMVKLCEEGGHKTAIHTSGTASIGRMMIRYFKKKGIKLINVVRRDDYNDALLKDGADYILNSKDPDFDSKFKEIGTKENATISFEAIAGDFTVRTMAAQPPGSICYLHGDLSNTGGANFVNVVELFQEKQLRGLYLANYVAQLAKTGKIVEFFNEIHSELETTLSTQVSRIYTIDTVLDALDWYKDNSSKGKILLKPN